MGVRLGQAPKTFLITISSEFLSRGLPWIRVLILGSLTDPDRYAFLLILLAAEGMVTAIAVHPSQMDTLVRRDLSLKLYWRLIPAVGIVSIAFLLFSGQSLYGGRAVDTFLVPVVVSAALGGAVMLIELTCLRVKNIRLYNSAKVLCAVLTTSLFLTLLPLDWRWLPAINLAGASVALLVNRVIARYVSVEPPSHRIPENLQWHAAGFFIYGVQALANSLPQFGVRIYVESNLGSGDVIAYTHSYQIASVLMFVLAAAWVPIEARQTASAESTEIRKRIRITLFLAAFFVCLAVGYVVFLAFVYFAFPELLPWMGLDIALLPTVALVFYVAISAIGTTLNAIALSLNLRLLSASSSILSALSLISALWLLSAAASLTTVSLLIVVTALLGTTLLGLGVMARIRHGRN